MHVPVVRGREVVRSASRRDCGGLAAAAEPRACSVASRLMMPMVAMQRVRWFTSTCLLLVVTAVASISPAQQPTVTSSYGPTNQTATFGEIKAARMAVKAGRAKAHADLLSSRYVLDARTDLVHP